MNALLGNLIKEVYQTVLLGDLIVVRANRTSLGP